MEKGTDRSAINRMTKEKPNAPLPYSEDGQGFVGEGRGAPEAPLKQKETEQKDEKKD